MIKAYPAIIHEEDGFWVEFPNLPGCSTCGSTLEETLKLASEALSLYLVSLLEDGQLLPAASALEDIDPSDGTCTYIATDIKQIDF